MMLWRARLGATVLGDFRARTKADALAQVLEELLEPELAARARRGDFDERDVKVGRALVVVEAFAGSTEGLA